ncbi:TauD/TfdA family dioxygenase [Vibrio spartinae]|uniref:L-asparagine oxygenase n=1 Tax=Vibrio spartinae TaxID=1918945 RepID=A0ABX6R144_9VIBR|nr:TauD/TfdA family dioxygenase [Vibrio spartinae]QMV14895.1 L-asparagine oxygenase [Vibrio spartinae]
MGTSINIRSENVLDNINLIFNPFLSAESQVLKNQFIHGQRDYLFLKNTGFNIDSDVYAKNRELDLGLQYSFMASMFNHLNIHPVTYEGENNGKLFRHVTPIPGFENTKSSLGSKENLGFHVDNNHMSLKNETVKKGHSCVPDYLALFCVRNNEKIPTIISDIPSAFTKLSTQDQHTLTMKRFKINYPDSFSQKGHVIVPIVNVTPKGIYSRFDAAFTHPLDQQANDAFQRLHNKLIEGQTKINLESGDILIFRNQKIAHARTGFTPKYDGYDRFLLRLFGVDSLDRVTSLFSDNPYHVTAY